MPKAYLQVLGVSTSDSSPSVLLFFDDRRYLFNVGEGSQRFCCEHGVKLSGIGHIFLTSLSWSRIGGLPGTVLTMADSGHQGIGLYGALGLRKLLGAMRPFMHREQFPLQVHEVGCRVSEDREIFSDKNLCVRGVALCPVPDRGVKRKVDERNDDSRPRMETTVCYACDLPPAPGKFDVAKAKQLGVPPGPLYGRLKDGHTVTLESGRTVLPSECVGVAPVHHRVIIVECPTMEHVSCLCASELLRPTGTPSYIVHITPAHVLLHPAYCAWAASHGHTALHIVANSSVCTDQINFLSASRNAQMLHRLSPHMFAEPQFSGTNTQALIHGLAESQVVAAQPLAKFHLDPPRLAGQIDLTCTILPFEPNDCDAAAKQLFKLQQQLQHTGECTQVCKGPQRVTFLGTGSMMPSKYRNVSGIHIQLEPGHGVLLDPGEGTLGQMSRCFDQVSQLLQELGMIWISHMHADHHLGTLAVIKARMETTSAQPLVVLAPGALQSWLQAYSKLVEPIDYHFFNIERFSFDSLLPTWNQLGISSLVNVPVEHCRNAFGLVLGHSSGWRLVYSGDTRPCAALEQSGQGADLLIHEATFDDELEHEARAKNHSTTAEALKSAQLMNVQNVILTHFSQRYPKIPVISEHQSNQNVVFAFDLMHVTMRDMPTFTQLVPNLQLLFPTEAEEDADPTITVNAKENPTEDASFLCTEEEDANPCPKTLDN